MVYMFMDEEGNEKLGGGSIGHYVLLPWRSLFSYEEFVCRVLAFIRVIRLSIF
jgi:hypothetical protein